MPMDAGIDLAQGERAVHAGFARPQEIQVGAVENEDSPRPVHRHGRERITPGGRAATADTPPAADRPEGFSGARNLDGSHGIMAA
jgi:hypothetical protein